MYSFLVPEKIIYGEDVIPKSMEYIARLGKRAFVVTGKHVRASNVMTVLLTSLTKKGVDFYVYDDIVSEPTVDMVIAGAEAFMDNGCDFCIAIGGGSPIDAAKAISVATVDKSLILDNAGREINGEFPPVVAVPTTAGTGSEVTRFTIITDSATDVKMLLKGDALIPNMAIVDYNASVTMPKVVTAMTGFDALTHAIEAYVSVKSSPMTDVLAVSSVKKIISSLPVVYNNPADKEARSRMSIAALEAGICINNSSVTLVHGMSRPIGALFHVPHGLSNAMLLLPCLRNMSTTGVVATQRFALLSRETGLSGCELSDEDCVKILFDKIENLLKICEVASLKSYGVNETEFFARIPKMSEDAVASGSPANSPCKYTVEMIEQIYRTAYDSCV